MNITNNISSLQANQTYLNTSANTLASSTKNSQTDITKAITDQIVASDTTQLNVSAINTQNEMLGTLLDMKV